MAMPMAIGDEDFELGAVLGDPALRARLLGFVAARMAAAEAEDVVQTTLTDALAARRAPATRQEVERWLFAIAKNKIVDHYRRRRREVSHDGDLSDEVSADSAPLGARDLLRWAERELPAGEGADRTLEWMLREADGEKLEHIAAEQEVPAPRVRQRVTRMRQHYRRRWAVELGVAAALAGVVLAIYSLHRARSLTEVAPIAEERVPRLEQAGRLRRAALDDCAAARWRACVDGLDRARALDPAGDTAPPVKSAREAAARALRAAPPLTPSIDEQVAPTPSAVPAPAPSAAPAPAPSDGRKTAPRIAPKAPLDLRMKEAPKLAPTTVPKPLSAPPESNAEPRAPEPSQAPAPPTKL